MINALEAQPEVISAPIAELTDYILQALKQRCQIEVDDCEPTMPLFKIIEYARLQGYHHALVETEYTDTDWLDLMSHYYYRYLRDISNKCFRVHFLKKELDPATPDCLVDLDDSLYLGYCSVRPLVMIGPKNRLLGQVSRTLLKPPENARCVPCHAKYRANLMGKNLAIQCMPFIQQDVFVGTCAQASIWMALRYLGHRDHRSEVCMAEITKAANAKSQVGPMFPATGLFDAQMINALSAFGYSPYYRKWKLFKHQPQAKFLHTIYKCIESGLPVLLSFKRLKDDRPHAVCLIGHYFDPAGPDKQKLELQPGAKNQTPKAIYTPLNFIPDFVCHDDAFGPYDEIKIRELLAKNKIESVIAPFPEDVNYFGEDLELHAFEALNEFAELDDKQKDDLLLRCFMIRSNDYKQAIRRTDYLMDQRVKEIYLKSFMPKYIWVVEISSFSRFQQNAKNNIMIQGEMIFDTISNPTFERNKFLYLHHLGNIAANINGQIYADDIKNDKGPYQCLIRQFNKRKPEYGPAQTGNI